jgi:hypothetical protein
MDYAYLFLIFGQILIDLIILALLVWLIRVTGERVKSERSPMGDLQMPEVLVKEIREIAEDLGKNLEQKRRISHDILSRLDDKLEQADAFVKIMENIRQADCLQFGERIFDSKDREQTRSSIQSLLSKGFSKEEIARHLGITLGEIELLIKLQPVKSP